MTCKALLNTASSGAQSVLAGGTIALGSMQHQRGNAIDLNGTSINVKQAGDYAVDVSAVVAPIAVGTTTITLFNNGVAVPGATASGSVSTANNNATLSFPTMIRVPCCGNASTLSVVLTGNAATVNSISVRVVEV